MQIFRRIIIDFFRCTWQLLNFVRNLIINTFLIFLIITYSTYLIRTTSNNNSNNFKHGALLLDITGVIVDKPSTKNQIGIISRQLFGMNSGQLQENSLFNIVYAIRQAKDDSNITGIILDLKNFVGADQPSMQYIGKVLNEFRNTGKPVIAIGDNYSQCQYYLASFSDKIWLSNHGMVDLHGFSTNKMYYKSLLNKLKITTHVFRAGIYKSAIEPFTRDGISSEAREDDSLWINELWQNYLSTISANRRISIQKIFPGAKGILDGIYKVNGNAAKYALDRKLVDALGSRIEIETELSKQFGWNNANRKYCAISIYDYVTKKSSQEGDAVAVIFVDGMIIEGKGISRNVGSDIIASQIREASFNPKIKVIVLRVNSSGGSMKASEIIREELAVARTMGKPVVVSMGGIAASGGYWISTPASYIIADKNTLTGSIGVFGIINTIENSLDYLGIHTDGVTTSPLADVTITKSLPLEISQIMQLKIKNSYDYFITLVAQSRSKTKDQIDRIAQGHIWTGQGAKNNGLVDSLGDFDDAVAKAVELAGLKQWHIKYYQNKLNFFDVIFDNIFYSTLTILSNLICEYLPIQMVTSIHSIINKNDRFSTFIFNDPQGCYALCLSCSIMN